MKNYLIIAMLVMASLFTTQEVKASHFAGADLTYTCLGGNTYLISLSFYRDCSGIGAPNSVTVNFNCSSNPNFNFTATLNKIPGTGQEVTPGCSAIPTKCSNGSNYGIQEYVYQATVTLVPCNSWTMSYSSCCRNPITTVPNNSSNSWYMKAELNNLSAPCNSSPTFSNKPVAVACNGQSFCFNHGALDPDGDSLVYSFYAPYKSAGQSIIYSPPYSASNFVLSNPPITLDPLTGDICFNATTNVTTATGIKVEEWRTINGTPTLIGTVYRDIQLKIDYCNNNIPTLSGMDTLNTNTYNPNDTIYAIEMCLGPTVDFTIHGYDADTFNSTVIGRPDIFHISWNQGIPAGTFTTYYNGTDSAYAHFSWTPTSADVSNVPKCFTATIHDEACPYYGSQTFSYCITVRGMLVDLIPSDTLLCTGDTLTYFANADTTTVNYIWRWNGQATSTPLNQRKYFVNTANFPPGIDTLSIETNDGSTTMACPGRDQVIIEHVYQPHIHNTIPDSAFCDGGSVTYDAGPGQTYLWMQGTSLVGASQTHTFKSSGIYTVIVDGGNTQKCIDIDTFEVAAIPNPDLGPDTCIWEADAPFQLNNIYTYPGMNWEWNDGSTADSLMVNISGTYSLSLYSNINPSIKCSDDVVVNVINQQNAITSAKVDALSDQESESPIPGDRKICTHQKLKIVGIEPPGNHTYQYTWSENGNVVSTAQFFVLKETEEGTYTIDLNVGGCPASIKVETEHCLVEPPNVITPYNKDGFNDVFFIGGLENFPNSELIIYNRWGKKIFESKNYQNDWDGGGASDGVYYWILKVADGMETSMQGTVTILSK